MKVEIFVIWRRNNIFKANLRLLKYFLVGNHEIFVGRTQSKLTFQIIILKIFNIFCNEYLEGKYFYGDNCNVQKQSLFCISKST